ncbi:hypothetical protein GGF46_005053 [Coemansia sp. RSA 552]|nr:hypothetical protein GGF46_005053 [Coemansia sp. RSA 552]
MAHSDGPWPKFLRRMSATVSPDYTPPSHPAAPPPPRRPDQQLYQPDDAMASTTSLSTGLQDLSLGLMQRQQQRFDESIGAVPVRQRDSGSFDMAGNRRIGIAALSSPNSADDQLPPTSDRVAEFSLDIPDGVRNTTQHPGSMIVGSAVLTLTKPTKALRITLAFLGQQRVYLRDTSGQAPLSMSTNVDYTMFEKKLVLWGSELGRGEGAHQETLPAGTQRIPFSIKLPDVNYPSTIKRDKACRVRYLVWATFERPGTFMDHSMTTAKEEIHFDPVAYPTRPREALSISQSIAGKTDTPTAAIAVQVTGGLLQMPVVAGERVMYQLEARAHLDPAAAQAAEQHPPDASQLVIKYMRVYVEERLRARGLIKGREHTQTYHADLHAVTLVPDSASKPGKTSNASPLYSSSGYLRLPLDMCPFDSKQLRRSYHLRIECDVVDTASILGKVTRQKSTYVMHVPLDICTLPPESFDEAAYQNAYTDESRNLSSIVPPWHHMAAAEPEVKLGGWEAERCHIKWDRSNPTWIELAKKKNYV